MSASWFSVEHLGGDRPDGELVELRRLDVLDDDLVQTRQRLGAERLELLLLEVAVGQLSVALELVLVGELGVPDLEVVRGRLVDAHRPLGDRAERTRRRGP